MGTPLRLFLLLLAPFAACADGKNDPAPAGADALYRTVAALDEQLFGAYNRCDLKAFRTLLADDAEFYHDQGGAMFSPDALTESVGRNICGKVRRELVAGTLEVEPIKDWGAIETGTHRFCELATGKCEGIARFLHIWKNDGGHWRLSRIVSYNHHLSPEPK